MDPDPEPGERFSSSSFFKTTVLTVAFSSFYIYKTGKETSFHNAVLQDNHTVTTTEKEKPPSKKKIIYLTFDDGPNRGTRNVLRIIEQERVKATLFVIGEHVYASRTQSSIYDSASRMTIFEIANHSFTHALHNKYRQFYQLPDTVVKDFIRCADSLHLLSNIIRTPGRNIWLTKKLHCIDLKASTAAADSLYYYGFRAIGWDLEWHFNDEQHLVQTSEDMATEIDSAFSKQQTKTPGHLVLLAHDQAFACTQDSASLHQFIIRLKKNETYEFEQVSKYPGL